MAKKVAISKFKMLQSRNPLFLQLADLDREHLHIHPDKEYHRKKNYTTQLFKTDSEIKQFQTIFHEHSITRVD
jgi:hypothetical protein